MEPMSANWANLDTCLERGAPIIYPSSVMVYCVMANIDTMPEIRAKNFFHLCSCSSHSSGITSVAPT